MKITNENSVYEFTRNKNANQQEKIDFSVFDYDNNGIIDEVEYEDFVKSKQEGLIEVDGVFCGFEEINPFGAKESAINVKSEIKSEAKMAADKLLNKLFGEVNVPQTNESYSAIGTISKAELNQILNTNYDTRYASAATVEFAKQLHGIDDVIYVDKKGREYSIKSKDDLKTYQQSLPENPTDIPVGSIVIMDNVNGGNFHSGVLCGYTEDGKAIVVEANSDKANGGAAVVCYDFNSTTTKSIKGYIPIQGLSDEVPDQTQPDNVNGIVYAQQDPDQTQPDNINGVVQDQQEPVPAQPDGMPIIVPVEPTDINGVVQDQQEPVPAQPDGTPIIVPVEPTDINGVVQDQQEPVPAQPDGIPIIIPINVPINPDNNNGVVHDQQEPVPAQPDGDIPQIIVHIEPTDINGVVHDQQEPVPVQPDGTPIIVPVEPTDINGIVHDQQEPDLTQPDDINGVVHDQQDPDIPTVTIVDNEPDEQPNVVSEEQQQVHDILEFVKSVEDVDKRQEIDGVIYHYDTEGNIIYTEAAVDTTPKEKAPDALLGAGYLEAINGDDLNLDIYCQNYSKLFDKNDKTKYYEEIAKSITNTLARNFNIQATDSNGNYTAEMKSVYAQLLANNRETFEKSGYYLDENASIYEISTVLAKFSWDGDWSLDGTKVRNDHINLAGITIQPSEPADRIATLYEYNPDNQISSVTKIKLEGSKDISEYKPGEYEILTQQVYNYTNINGYVDITEHNFETGTDTKAAFDAGKYSAQIQFKNDYINAKSNAAEIVQEGSCIKYLDESGNIICRESTKASTQGKYTGLTSEETDEEIILSDVYGDEVTRIQGKPEVEYYKEQKDGHYNTYYYDTESDKWALFEQLSGCNQIELFDYDENGTLINYQRGYRKPDTQENVVQTLPLKTSGDDREPDTQENMVDASDNLVILATQEYEYGADGYEIKYINYQYDQPKYYSIVRTSEQIQTAQQYSDEIAEVRRTATQPEEKLRNDKNVKITGCYDENHRLLSRNDNELIRYDEQGRVHSIIQLGYNVKIYDESGKKIAATTDTHKIVMTETRYTYDGNTATEQVYDYAGNAIGEPRIISIDSNEKIEGEAVRQNGTGDCWYISSMISYSGTLGGQQAFEDAIEQMPDGNFRVSLYAPVVNEQGIVIGYENEKTDYIVTQAELFNILILSSPYAQGDIDAVIMERAKEQQYDDATKEQFQLNGLPRYNANYGPNRPYCQTQNDNMCELSYALFGGDAKTTNLSVDEYGNNIKTSEATKKSIAWLRDYGADVFANGNVAVMFDTCGKGAKCENVSGNVEKLITGHSYSLINCENTVRDGINDVIITLQETNSGAKTKMYLSDIEKAYESKDLYFYIRYYDFN